ncbi:PAN-complex poly(A)-binding subunit PAN3 KNAG_0H00120 [Huiozyma naganishii CBS 8797]|uniref:PAN2-PAN3 deadenylation complex subunit PAN3 n=1 Tax=Huiozyma naganishii (strain ATCC MYA-139 / BCRC 22969 / CBS 8797 / KCTC 17520 / NBRC 10181 / NCYC 3082 / Yp74L-3) TaxID=1071383 RepID=J7RP44_HUIN7|nr:hypothetical protein KNAG_0H00120 [Kazachstania naganishii CBS 8797]CCK71428.1 hypothetical protein KNAG_0H00120 [Kazachstania naganishii CBS 8797]
MPVIDKINADWARDVPCRNVIIYGFCKKQKEGCPFKHDGDTDETANGNRAVMGDSPPPKKTVIATTSLDAKMDSSPTSASRPSITIPPRNSTPVSAKFNAKASASFKPMSNGGSNRSINGGPQQVFGDNVSSQPQPQTQQHQPQPQAPFTPNFDAYKADFFTPLPHSTQPLSNTNILESDIGITHGMSSQLNNMSFTPTISAQSMTGGISESPIIMPPPLGDPEVTKLNFPSIYPPPHSILQYHLYAPEAPPQLKLPLKPNERKPEDLFIPNDLREDLVKRNLASLQIFPAGGSLPVIVQDYFGLVPLDFHEKKGETDRYSGHVNSLFKVFSNVDGKLYVLRRIHDISISDPSTITKTFQNWSKLQSSNVVQLRDLFTTTKFGDTSLCLVYDYYPNAVSLYETHFIRFPFLPITQDYLWSYLVQLISAMKSAHEVGLVLNKCLNWEKVIVTGNPGMIKVSGVGASDVANHENHEDMHTERNKDFEQLGNLLIRLSSCINNGTEGNLQTIDSLPVDDKFKKVLTYLKDTANQNKNISDLSSLFIDKIFTVFDSMKTYAEYTEKILARELENARLFRLMCKMNCIFGRTESRIDINWSESGEKFPIILFYDFVFHQMDESGKAIVDLTHILRCLNKLDAGAQEKIMLATSDNMNCIIISYKELKDLIDSTFRSMT